METVKTIAVMGAAWHETAAEWWNRSAAFERTMSGAGAARRLAQSEENAAHHLAAAMFARVTGRGGFANREI